MLEIITIYIVIYSLEINNPANYCNWNFLPFKIVKKRAAYWECLKSLIKIKRTPKVEENRS